MKKFLRLLWIAVLSLFGLIAMLGALFAYFLYTPEPEVPKLTGTLSKATMEVAGLSRKYRIYQPQELKQGAPLMLVMHGSGENGAEVRKGTGFGFDRLADQYGFIVVYPDSYSFDWNDCGKIGDFSVNGVEVDDVGFLRSLVDKLIVEHGVDRQHVFASGVSSGGFMAMRLALEAPTVFRAIAAVAANVHVPENFKCKPAVPGSSVMIVNGTNDPLVPFDGGEINLLGWFYKGGNVLSSRQSAQYFADFNAIQSSPLMQSQTISEALTVEKILWKNTGKTQVELVAIHGGGHGLPQPYARRPRLLGPSPMQPDGPAIIWEFFSRQQP